MIMNTQNCMDQVLPFEYSAIEMWSRPGLQTIFDVQIYPYAMKRKVERYMIRNIKSGMHNLLCLLHASLNA